MVLKFDRNQPISLSNYASRTIIVNAPGLEQTDFRIASKGYLRNIKVLPGRIELDYSVYAKVKVIPAGTGIYVLQAVKGVEPVETTAPVQTPVATQPQREEPVNTGQSEEPYTTPVKDDTEIDVQNTYRENDPSADTAIPTTVKLAIQLASEGESGRAIALLNSIQPSDPEFPWSRFAIGKIYEQNGEISRALDKYRQALIYPETESIAAVHIALAFQSMGNAESAVSMWERVLELSGGNLNLPDGAPKKTKFEILETPEEKIPLFVRFRMYLIILGGAILLATGIFLFFFFKNRSSKMGDLDEFGIPTDMYEENEEDKESVGPKVAKMYAEQQDSDVDEDDDLDSQIAELDKMVEENIDLDEDDIMEGSPLSDTKMKKVQTLHDQGATVREIAETLGLGQDEVRMAINLSEA